MNLFPETLLGLEPRWALQVTSVAALDAQLSQLRAVDVALPGTKEIPRFDMAMIEHAPPEASARPVIQCLQESNMDIPVIGEIWTFTHMIIGRAGTIAASIQMAILHV